MRTSTRTIRSKIVRSIRDENKGQAVIEYALALCLIIVVTVGIGSYVRESQTSTSTGLSRQTFMRAPYTISSSVGSSGQCVKDILYH